MIKMDLWDNALSSLIEGLRCLIKADNGETDQYKFAVLHISHHFELALKYAIYEMHPLLIFKRPYSKNLADEKTITPQEAFYIIKNSGDSDSIEEVSVDDDEIEELTRIKKIRNSIEHYKFEMTPDEVKEDISIFLSFINSTLSQVCDITFSEYLDGAPLAYYCQLVGEE